MAPTIYIVDKRPKVSALMAANLQVFLNANVKILDKLGSINTKEEAFIIYDSKKVPRNMSASLPFYAYETHSEQVTNTVLQEQIQNTVRACAHYFRISAKHAHDACTDDMFPLGLESVLAGMTFSMKIYKFDGASFSTLLYPNQSFTSELRSLLKAQQLQHIFVKTEDRTRFVNEITNQILKNIKPQDLELEESLALAEAGFHAILRDAHALGLNEKSIETAESSVVFMRNSVEKIPSLRNYLAEIISQSSSFRFKQAFLSCLVTHHIMECIGELDSEKSEIITYAAFFQDISLPKDEYCQYRNDDIVKTCPLSPQAKKLIINHAFLSSKMLGQYSKIPIEVPALVQHHHGHSMGKSLSKVSTNLPPMSSSFILAREFAHELLILKPEEVEQKLPLIMRFLASRYPFPPYKLGLAHLKSILIEFKAA